MCKKLGSYICLSCQKKLVVFNRDMCFYCKKTSLFGLTHPCCKRVKGVDGCVFIYVYNNELKKIIKSLKYRLVRKGLKELLEISSDEIYNKLTRLIKLYKNIILSPTPLYKSRLNKRGFNQAEDICLFIKDHFKIPIEQFLSRKKDTKPQATIKGLKQRYLNIRGAFTVVNQQKIKDKNIILVYDVVTSGSTVREACLKLKQNKASHVFVFALAKG